MTDRAVLDEIAAAAREGDRRAFERLVVETSPDIYTLVLRLVGDEQDALDVVQETYLRAFRGIRRFRGDSAVTTWLHRIAVNCASSHLARRRDPTAQLDEDSLVERREERLPEQVAGATADRERLLEALAVLPDSLRVVVVLHDVYDFSHERITAELGISKTAAKVRLHRARRKLRDLLFAEVLPEAQRTEHPDSKTRPIPLVRPMARRSEARTSEARGLVAGGSRER